MKPTVRPHQWCIIFLHFVRLHFVVDYLGLRQIYDSYSENVIPQLGEWIANDRESYKVRVTCAEFSVSVRICMYRGYLCALDRMYNYVSFRNLMSGLSMSA